MGFLQLYARVLAKLGADRRLGWLLALANIAVASALFAEPVLFGRVINVLAAAQADVESVDWTRLWILIVVWAALGLFTILCGTLIALVSDRLAHRRRLAVLTGYFEHVLQLPLAYHGETHSGRLMTMLCGRSGSVFSANILPPLCRSSSSSHWPSFSTGEWRSC
jgi:ATP-binding cassette subfamily B protein